jgi:GNAT superfamily N-acetyltransferase
VIDGWLQGRETAIYLPLLESAALFVAEGDSGVLAFGEAAPGSILAVYVDPESTGRGIGTALLGFAI